MAELSSLECELRDKIIARLNLRYVDAKTVTSDMPLFKEGLGLDSIDVLEIGIMVEEDYGIVIGPAERDKSVFGTLGHLAAFVSQNLRRDAASL